MAGLGQRNISNASLIPLCFRVRRNTRGWLVNNNSFSGTAEIRKNIFLRNPFFHSTYFYPSGDRARVFLTSLSGIEKERKRERERENPGVDQRMTHYPADLHSAMFPPSPRKSVVPSEEEAQTVSFSLYLSLSLFLSICLFLSLSLSFSLNIQSRINNAINSTQSGRRARCAR